MPGFLGVITRCLSPRREPPCSKAKTRHNKDDISEEKASSPDYTDTTDFRPNDSYERITDLQDGEEGHCSVVRSKTTGKLVVIKRIQLPKSKSPNVEQTGRRLPIPNEAKILLDKLHPPPHTNIIRLFATEQSPATIGRHFLYMEYCSGGDLLDQLRKFQKLKTPVPEICTLHVFIGLAQALAYIHHGLRYKGGSNYIRDWPTHQSVIHGDIKPDNIFLRFRPGVGECEMPNVVLADFGMAQVAAESWGIAGTPGYDSPEVQNLSQLRETDPEAYHRRQNNRIMTAKSDVYQLGLVIYLMATDKHFPPGKDPWTIILPIEYRRITGLLAAIVWCLQLDPRHRPECTTHTEHGILFAVDTFRKKRDARYALDGALGQDVWNIGEMK